MKLIIDTPEDVYTRLFDPGIQDNEIAVDDICEMARALRMGTPIPDNAKNGDVIKALFPRIKIKKFSTFLRVIEGEEYIPMTFDWWNAPYKRGEEE